jgi:hypothetical protein
MSKRVSVGHGKTILGTVLALVIIAVVLVGISFYFTKLHPTQIKNLLDNPRDYAGKTVTIKGTVSDRASFIVIKSFSLKDDTGQIIVITDKPLPRVGDTISVKGKIEEAFSIGTEQLLVFIEVNEIQ